MAKLRLYLFGPPRVEIKGHTIRINRRKALALLIYLALAEYPQSRDVLATLLWPDYDQVQARTALRRDLSALNKALGGDQIEADRNTISLKDRENAWIDVVQFRRLQSGHPDHLHASDQPCSACLLELNQAIALYTADFLAGFTLTDSVGFDQWQAVQTERLRQELTQVFERIVAGYERQGAYPEALTYAQQWATFDPLQEQAHQALMTLYWQMGRPAQALQQFHTCAKLLKAEFDLLPQETTLALYDQIRISSIPSFDYAPTKNLKSPGQMENSQTKVDPTADHRSRLCPKLSLSVTPFIGRMREVTEITKQLADPACRLLTLVGLGGSGKTRLALEVAGQLDENFIDGVYFIQLSEITSPTLIVPTIIKVLQLPLLENQSLKQQLIDYLAPRSMLLVIDNFEHLLESRQFLIDLLATAPGLKLLITSRVRLNLQAEILLPIAGLTYPNGQLETESALAAYDAVTLFVTCARRLRPDFDPTEDNLQAISRICQLAAGMPLTITLAAGWVMLISPAQIAAEMEDTLDLLKADTLDLPERQRSLRRVFDQTWNLLTAGEQEIVLTAAIFRGGFTTAALSCVSEASPTVFRTLVYKSIFQATVTDRLTMHPLLRKYLWDRLRQVPTQQEILRDRHCRYYADLTEQLTLSLGMANQEMVLDQIEADLENINDAWHWAAAQGHSTQLAQMVEGICHFYSRQGRYKEGQLSCRLAIESLFTEGTVESLQAGVPSFGITTASLSKQRLWLELSTWLGFFSARLGETALANQSLKGSLKGLQILDLDQAFSPNEKAMLWRRVGSTLFDSERDQARQLYQQSLRLYQATGNGWEAANVLAQLGRVARRTGRLTEAEQLYWESLRIHRSLGDERGAGHAMMALGQLAIRRGKYEDGEDLFREGLRLYQEGCSQADLAVITVKLGLKAMYFGQFTEARNYFGQSLDLFQDLNLPTGIADTYILLGLTNAHQGNYLEARDQVETGFAIAKNVDYQPGVSLARSILAEFALQRKDFYQAQNYLHQNMTVAKSIKQPQSEASTLLWLSYLHQQWERPIQAHQFLRNALPIVSDIGTVFLLTQCTLIAAAFLAQQKGRSAVVDPQTVILYDPMTARSHLLADIIGYQPLDQDTKTSTDGIKQLQNLVQHMARQIATFDELSS